MSAGSSIEWTEATWNPTTGCDRVSPGCDHCYALTLAGRLKAMGQAKYQRDGDPRTSGPGFGLAIHPDTLETPLRWRKPRRVFVNSMSDLFHDRVPAAFIAEVFAVMAAAHQHTFQVLTKRHARMRSLLNDPDFLGEVRAETATLAHEGINVTVNNPWEVWPLPNVWLGVSVENQQWADIRLPVLLDTPAAVRWLSCEPLLGPVDLAAWLPRTSHLSEACGPHCVDGYCCDSDADRRLRLGWVVVGGESGRDARPIHRDWARSLREQCTDAGVPFFFKQWGGRTPHAGGRILDGRLWDQYPLTGNDRRREVPAHA